MNSNKIGSQIISFFKDIYKVWFPWLDIVILTFIYFFLWGEHINPYRQYQLIKYGDIATGTITGESGLYANSDRPRMRNFGFTFNLSNGKIIQSSSHTFKIDEVDSKQRKFPVSAEISYLPRKPEINWIKSDLPNNIANFLKRNLMGGLVFILMAYLIITTIVRLSILDYREQKSNNRVE